MSRTFLILFSILGMLSFADAQEVPSLPYQPSLLADAKGHEWYIEQNGTLQRNGSGASMIGNCMALQLGNQQFYSQQPLTTADGKEISMSAQQPYNGIAITRRITFMQREAALRYVDEFFNTTSRDVTLTVEIRHGLNNSARELTSNLGRVIAGPLEPQESGILALPGDSERSAPALFLSIRTPKSSVPLRLRVQNKYQISIFYSLTIPAGQSQTLIHGIAQIQLDAKATPDQISKVCAPFALDRLARGLPKSVLKSAANLGSAGNGFGGGEFFPDDFWGISPGASDQLALGRDSLLKGTAAMTGLSLQREGGVVTPELENIAAIAGPVFTDDAMSWLWLRDGQLLHGVLSAEVVRFTLLSGAELPVARLDRLVPAKSAEPRPPLAHPLIELLNGERIIIHPEGEFKGSSPWGEISVPWSDLIALQKTDDESFGGLLSLRDGTRVRLLPQAGKSQIKTLSLGVQNIDLADLRRLITPLAMTTSEEDAEPTTSFLDLAGGQRLVARIVDATLTLATEAGPLALPPASIRELRDVSQDDASHLRAFEAHVWGGGVVRGTLEDSRIKVEGRGFIWEIPVRHILRVVNPIPVTENSLMRRIGQLIQDLGHEQWKTRESSTTALRELGPLARGSLQEALKSATDAEVARRLEELLQDTE
jgi:hypothetical protein